jgi:hypothetical protein
MNTSRRFCNGVQDVDALNSSTPKLGTQLSGANKKRNVRASDSSNVIFRGVGLILYKNCGPLFMQVFREWIEFTANFDFTLHRQMIIRFF